MPIAALAVNASEDLDAVIAAIRKHGGADSEDIRATIDLGDPVLVFELEPAVWDDDWEDQYEAPEEAELVVSEINRVYRAIDDLKSAGAEIRYFLGDTEEDMIELDQPGFLRDAGNITENYEAGWE